MYKKAIVFFSLFALVGCNSGGPVETQVTMLTDQISGCLYDAVSKKGGSVVIKNQPQYSNFQSELNALGEASELCESGVELPEVAFGDAVFVAKNMTQVCVLDVVVETSEEEEVYRVMISEDTSSFEGQECESYTDGAVAFALEGVPSGASIVIE